MVLARPLWSSKCIKCESNIFVDVFQEYEIDKSLNIKGPEDVAKMGIKEYNKQCRSIVMRYANEWEVRVSVMTSEMM